MKHTAFRQNQKVRNCYGRTLTVAFQIGCQVFVKEEAGSWYHPSNLFAA
jgi:hypothetical protein